MRESAVIVDAVRTPLGKKGGVLSGIHPVDLSARVLEALVERSSLDPALVDDVLWGCVTQIGAQSSNVGRLAVLAAGWSECVPGTTIDRACGSSQQALQFAAAGIVAGDYDIVIAGGVESMSQVPMGSARAVGEPYGPSVIGRYGRSSFSQGEGAEEIARRWGLTRADLDEYALNSHRRAAAAADSGEWDGQIVSVETANGTVRQDEGIRRDTSLEKLAGLESVFVEGGVVTAGNSSQISDGAAGLLLMSARRAAELGLTPMAVLRAGVVVGDDPVTMLTAPVPATRKLLAKTHLTVEDIDVFEINEAFAPVVGMWRRELGASEAQTNPRGGAIAVGHPLGASGAVLMTRMVHHLSASGGRYGVQSMCEAGGMANATLIERWTA